MWQNTYNLKTWIVHNSHLETRAVPLSLLSKHTGACALVVFAVAKQPWAALAIQVVTVFESIERRPLSREWAWFQRRQRTRPQRLRADSPAYFSKILITYFSYLVVFLSFKFSWVVNNTFFCCVTNSEHILISLYTDFKWLVSIHLSIL